MIVLFPLVSISCSDLPRLCSISHTVFFIAGHLYLWFVPAHKLDCSNKIFVATPNFIFFWTIHTFWMRKIHMALCKKEDIIIHWIFFSCRTFLYGILTRIWLFSFAQHNLWKRVQKCVHLQTIWKQDFYCIFDSIFEYCKTEVTAFFRNAWKLITKRLP